MEIKLTDQRHLLLIVITKLLLAIKIMIIYSSKNIILNNLYYIF